MSTVPWLIRTLPSTSYGSDTNPLNPALITGEQEPTWKSPLVVGVLEALMPWTNKGSLEISWFRYVRPWISLWPSGRPLYVLEYCAPAVYPDESLFCQKMQLVNSAPPE